MILPKPCATIVGATTARHEEWAVDIGRDHAPPSVGVGAPDRFARSAHRHSGVVDENMHRAESRGYFRSDAPALLRLPQIADDGDQPRLRAWRGGARERLIKLRALPRGDHGYPRAGLRERKRHGAAEPTTAAGHDDRAIGKGRITWRIIRHCGYHARYF